MKIKLNENYPGIKKLQNALVMEFPELNLRVKPRSKWGLEKPSFKLGKKLYEFDTEEALLGKLHSLIAKEPEQAAIVLDVWEHNPAAQRFYARYGFEVVGARAFVVASGAETSRDLIMVRRSPGVPAAGGS